MCVTQIRLSLFQAAKLSDPIVSIWCKLFVVVVTENSDDNQTDSQTATPPQLQTARSRVGTIEIRSLEAGLP